MFKIFSLPLIFILSILSSIGQSELKATVIDNDTKRPLPFVNVIAYHGETRSGATTNVEGNFTLSFSQKPDSIKISFVGYETLLLDDYSKSTFYLVPLTLQLGDIEVRPGLNPALRIIRNAVENLKENNVQKHKAYTHDIYNVFNIDVDDVNQIDVKTLTDTSQIKKAEFFLKQQAFLMETYSTIHFKPPSKRKETITATRTSGLKNPLLATLAAQIQPVSAYDNPITLFSKDYLNPISKGGLNGYYFILRDTLYDGKDSVFIIDFAPKRGSNFEGVKGKVFIHSENWAITNAVFDMESILGVGLDEDAISIGSSGKENPTLMSIIIAYERVSGGHWFPHEVRTTIPMGKIIGERKFYMWNTSFYKNVDFENPDKKVKMGGAPIEVKDVALERDDAFWNELKGTQLTERELETYRFNDSVSKESNLDRKLELLTTLSKGYIRFNTIDLNILDVLNYNEFEGIRLGVGGKTNERLIKWMSIGGYGAYGIRDNRFKYGGEVELHLKKSHAFTLRTLYKDDVKATGYYDVLNPGGTIDQGKLYRDLYVNQMEYVQNLGFEAEGYLFKSFFIKGFNHNKRIWTGYDYTFLDPTASSSGSFFRVVETGVSFNWKIKDEYIQLGKERIYIKEPKFPVINGSLVKGWDDIWFGDYAYWRMQIRLDQCFRVMRIGTLALRAEYMKVIGDVPLPLLVQTPGVFSRGGFTAPNSFETVVPTEFTNDQLLTSYLMMTFNPFRSKNNKFAPILSLRVNAGWGMLSNVDRHPLTSIKTMEKGLYEGGFVLDDLLKISIVGIGVGYFHRIGAYAASNEFDNMAFKLSMKMKF
jgi:hypothetical protein